MPTTSAATKATNILKLSTECLRVTHSDKKAYKRLKDLSIRVEMLLDFVYGYTFLKDDNIDSDDEIINWTFVDVTDDLNAAIWNIASGFYKCSAALMRNALDLAMASVYFQLLQNRDPLVYCEEFSRWETGRADTPGWKLTEPVISGTDAVRRFNARYRCDIAKEIHGHFKQLCNRTHNRAFAPSGEAINNKNLGLDAPSFDEGSFHRMSLLLEKTVAHIATIWLVAFPGILACDPLHDLSDMSKYEKLLSHRRGMQALQAAPIAAGRRRT
jgi:hypothetical protein